MTSERRLGDDCPAAGASLSSRLCAARFAFRKNLTASWGSCASQHVGRDGSHGEREHQLLDELGGAGEKRPGLDFNIEASQPARQFAAFG